MKKLTAFFLLLLLTLYPLYFGSGGYRTIENDKYPLFLLLGGAMTLLFLAGLLCTKKHSLRKNRFPLFAVFALLLLLSLTVSAACSDFPERVWLGGQRRDGVLTWALYLGIFAVCASHGHLSRLTDAALSVCLAFTAVLSFLQKCGMNLFGLYPDGITWLHGGNGFLATIGNIDFLSAFSVLGLTLLFGRYLTRTDRGRWLPLTGAAFGIFALYLASAKAGKLALFLTLLYALWHALQSRARLRRYFFGIAVLAGTLTVLSLLRRQQTKDGVRVLLMVSEKTMFRGGLTVLFAGLGLGAKKLPLPGWVRKSKRGLSLAVVLLLALGSLMAVYFFGERIGGLPSQMWKVLHGTATAHTGSGRFGIWQQSLELIREAPLLGSGPDTMGLRITADNAHSIFLNLWVNGGIFSLLSFCLLLGSILLFARRRQTPQTFALTLPVIAYTAQAAVTVDEFIVAPLFWAVLGLLAGQSGTQSRKQ